MISLGCYQLDIVEMRLMRDGEEAILEPKVLKVLLYFIENNNRYITMEELHENLWHGRIVSDAAVRRIISKLRTLFNDDHTAPKYIKSLSKSGYKLICNIEYIDAAVTPNTSSQENSHTPDTSLLADTITNKNRAKIKKLVLTIFIVFLMLFTANSIYSKFYIKKSIEKIPVVTSHVIKSLPGIKNSVAQSLNNQHLAFSGKASEEEGYKIFIKNNKKHVFSAIKAKFFLPFYLTFSADSKNLFYADLKEGSSSLNVVSLTDSFYQKKVLLDNYFWIESVFTSPNNQLIYFSGQKYQNEPSLIYSYNIKTRNIKKITHSTQNYYFDTSGDISPNGKLLATVRYSSYEKSNEVQQF